MRRRKLMAAVGSTATVAATAGCLTGGNDDEDTTAAGDDSGAATNASNADGSTTASDGDGAGADEEGDGATTSEDASSGDGSDGSANVDFEATVERVETCSATCRTLTYALENRGTDVAPDVVVRIRVFTGGKKVWDEEQAVGSIEAGSTLSGIGRDIDVGLLGGQKIKSNDGEVVIKLTPRAAGVSETFTFERTLDV
ncbi:hypothetical protein [Halorubellus litoreus]|uniref:DUF4352 domain-containing protein n=1 Tax=Halorubellus litoreus TaxID=755308 RepID=A0ABD5VJ46_9EURY